MNDLLIRNDAELSVRIAEDALQLKTRALEKSGIIGRVSSAQEQETAVEAQRAIKSLRKLAEDSRKSIKAPVLDFGRAIDAAAKEFDADLAEEDLRLARLIADFQTLEQARVRAAEAARLKELNSIEQERQKQTAEAKSHEDLDRINYEACQKQAELAPVEIARAEGQTLRTDWEINVLDVHRLYLRHRHCVHLEVRISEIRQLLDAWSTMESSVFDSMCREAGLSAKRVVKTGVRLGRQTTSQGGA